MPVSRSETAEAIFKQEQVVSQGSMSMVCVSYRSSAIVVAV